MSIVDEFSRVLPPLWVRTLSKLCEQKLLTGNDTDPFHDVATRWLNHCVAVNDRDGIRRAQRLVMVVVEARTPEQVAAIEKKLGLTATPSLRRKQGGARGSALVIQFPANRIHRYSTPDGMVDGPARPSLQKRPLVFRGEIPF